MTKKPRISYFPPTGYRGPSSSPGTVRVHWKGGKREKAGSGVFIHGHDEEFRRAVVEITKEYSRGGLRFTGRFLDASEPKPKKRGLFGKYKDKFSVGPEFFEPLSPEDRKAWGED